MQKVLRGLTVVRSLTALGSLTALRSLTVVRSLTALFLLTTTGALVVQQSCLAETPKECVAENNAGVRLLGSGRLEEALPHFENAIKVDPTYDLARQNYAIALNNMALKVFSSDIRKALKYFRQALYIDGSNSTTRDNTERTMKALGKDPASLSDRIALADSALSEGDNIGAIVELKEAIKIKGEDADLQLKLSRAYLGAKDYSNATAAVYKAVQLKPTDSNARKALRDVWEEALKANPLEPTNHIGFGQALELCGDVKAAEEEYRIAIRMSRGQNSIAEDLLAKLLAAQKGN